MNFENKIPEWINEGTEPSADLKTNGFQPKFKPPAGIFNWFWSLIIKAITEIQNNLSKVDNTSDSEKSVKFASEAGVGRKVQYPFIFRLNGGKTESTDQWTYDGSTSRSVNLTPDKLGARPTEKPNIVVNATREVIDDTEIFTVTDSNITELYDGLEITVIPNERNTTTTPRLKINEFVDNGIRMALSFNCAATNALKENFFQANRPMTLKYHANCNLGIQGQGAWLFSDRIKVSAQDLYGTVPIESGGTGVNSLDDLKSTLNLPSTILWGSGSITLGQANEKWVGTTTIMTGSGFKYYVMVTPTSNFTASLSVEHFEDHFVVTAYADINDMVNFDYIAFAVAI